MSQTTHSDAEALEANRLAAQHGVDLSALPKLLDLNAESITDSVHTINSNCPDDRLKFLMKSLIDHLHDFARETSLTKEEWLIAIKFLTETGQKCSDIRQEVMLLSDVLGLTTLVQSINDAKPPGATEGTVLGPFFTEDAPDLAKGDSIASEGNGEYMLVEGRVLDTQGRPIAGAIINTWETSAEGLYDTQYASRTKPDYRGRLHSDDDGSYSFRAILPVSYPIPSDGPVGKLLIKLGRHVFRPAHLHIMIEAPGFEKLTTALYPRGDPYVTSDAVFGVKTSLIVDLETITDISASRALGFPQAKPYKLLKQDFILATHEQARKTRSKK